MNVKIDTKEKFTVITPNADIITANMTAQLEHLLLGYLNKAVPHVILDMQHIHAISDDAAEKIATLQQHFYEKNSSFVICAMNKNIAAFFESADLLDLLNVTPTESEAWDILQMEEVERELLRDFDNNENG